MDSGCREKPLIFPAISELTMEEEEKEEEDQASASSHVLHSTP